MGQVRSSSPRNIQPLEQPKPSTGLGSGLIVDIAPISIAPDGEPHSLLERSTVRVIVLAFVGLFLVAALMMVSHYFGFNLKLDLHISN